MRKFRQILSTEAYKKIEGIYWGLKKKPQDRSDSENEAINRVKHYSPKLRKAIYYIERLDAIFNSHSTRSQGKYEIKKWIAQIKRNHFPELNSFIKTLEKYMNEVINYFSSRHSSGFVEGLNNKIKCLKRRCYGMRNRSHFSKRLCLDVQGYSLFSISKINNLQI